VFLPLRLMLSIQTLLDKTAFRRRAQSHIVRLLN
jgi:hypothetical protein